LQKIRKDPDFYKKYALEVCKIGENQDLIDLENNQDQEESKEEEKSTANIGGNLMMHRSDSSSKG